MEVRGSAYRALQPLRYKVDLHHIIIKFNATDS